MSKSTIGKLVTAAFLLIAHLGLAYNAMIRPVGTAPFYTAFFGFLVVWGLVYWQLSKRGYFDWFDGP